jgi:hypothetical protein
MDQQPLTQAATQLSKIHPEGLDLSEAIAWSQATALVWIAGRLTGVETLLARLVDDLEGEPLDRLASIVATLRRLAEDLEQQALRK